MMLPGLCWLTFAEFTIPEMAIGVQYAVCSLSLLKSEKGLMMRSTGSVSSDLGLFIRRRCSGGNRFGLLYSSSFWKTTYWTCCLLYRTVIRNDTRRQLSL